MGLEGSIDIIDLLICYSSTTVFFEGNLPKLHPCLTFNAPLDISV